MHDNTRAAYETVLYEGKLIRATHVESLETIAFLHGVRPASCDQARVLELGCATAGNIIAMAHQFPESAFVGVDFARNQIAEGKRVVAELAQTNVELHAMSVGDIGAEFGLFDYIICHGVYSWVAPNIQDAILRVCSENLAPNGVAYVSFNAYPGWKQREVVRDMTRFHDDPALPSDARAARARTFVDLVAEERVGRDVVYGAVLADEAEALRKQADYHLVHEQLEPFNTPMYFTQFAAHASSHGLNYVCEARPWPLEPQLEKWVQWAGVDEPDVVRLQQYMDFVYGRKFRRALLCHSGVEVQRVLAPEQMALLHFSIRGERVAAADSATGAPVETFKSQSGPSITTGNPTIVAAMQTLLDASPGSVSFPELFQQVGERLAAEPAVQRADPDSLLPDLAKFILQCMTGGIVEVSRHRSRIATQVSERPRVSPLTRLRAAEGGLVTNLEHGQLEVSASDRTILMHLDGTRTRADLLDILTDAIVSGKLGPNVAHPAREVLASALDVELERFARSAMLEG